MSVERHPNINAAGFYADVIAAYLQRLRGAAQGAENKRAAIDVFHPLVTDFINKLDAALDERFPP